MAERQSMKRDFPEDSKTSEAEAKPSNSTIPPVDKRLKTTEEELPDVDSTTVFLQGGNKDGATAGPSNSASAVLKEVIEPLGQSVSEDRPSTDENNPSCSSSLTLIEPGTAKDPDAFPIDSRDTVNASANKSEATCTGLSSADPTCSGLDQNGSKPEGSDNSVGSPMASSACCDSPQASGIDTRDAANSNQQANSASDALGDPGHSSGHSEASPLGVDERDAQGRSGVGGMAPETGRMTRKDPLTGLREVDVGIVEYVSKHEGFHGVIKQRYQDFLVNEVDQDGKIVHLTDMTSPDPQKEELINIDEVLSDNDQQKLNELTTTTDKKAFHCITVQDLDKDQRTKIHGVIRQGFANLESCTLDEDGEKFIKVTKVTRGGRKQRSNWLKSNPNYCRFVMHKENMEVNDALSLMSKYLHIRQQSFGFSGTKDKRGITVQELTVYRVEAERLSRLNSILRGIRLGNFRYVKDPLTLGDHTGNHFIIILRDVEGSKEQIDHALTSMRDTGFINYFGMQRFGNSQVATHLVGRAVLHSNWQEAVDLILKPRERDKQDNRWRQLWMDSRNAKSVMDILPKHKTISIEMQLLKGLHESKNNYFKSLQCVPRNVRLLYVHSYQSFVWNTLVTRRIQKYGLKIIPGDLVIKEKESDDETEHVQVSVVADGLLESYSIQDIVLPLPGYSMQYPQNEICDWYRELLERDGLDISNMRHQVKDYSLSGTYRKMVVKPGNVSWSIISYSDTTVPLVQTDLDRLEKKETLPLESDGHLQALRLDFTLSSCCYATMAIREVLKIDTSAAHQSSLNPVPPRDANAVLVGIDALETT